MSDNVAASREPFGNFSVTVQKYIIAFSRCKQFLKLFNSAVTVQPDGNLQPAQNCSSDPLTVMGGWGEGEDGWQ
jgi:hypothetical protein